jgi:hypothetical protein
MTPVPVHSRVRAKSLEWGACLANSRKPPGPVVTFRPAWKFTTGDQRLAGLLRFSLADPVETVSRTAINLKQLTSMALSDLAHDARCGIIRRGVGSACAFDHGADTLGTTREEPT